jgi:voltage-gated sodium channel
MSTPIEHRRLLRRARETATRGIAAPFRQLPRWIEWLLAEPVVLTLIAINGAAVFLDAFPTVHAQHGPTLFWIDYACLLYFVFEMGARMVRRGGFRGYWRFSGWNRFDFVIVAISLPTLLAPAVPMLDEFAVLSAGRVLRFARLLRFVPNALELWAGLKRALKASVAVFCVLALMNLLFALGAMALFGDVAPQYFGDPGRAMYTLFKVFTIEGWYEVPDAIAEDVAASGRLLSGAWWVGAVRAYFVIAVLCGGLLGLSLANAVFVDEMTADNTRRVEALVAELTDELRGYRAETERLRRELRRRPRFPERHPPDDDEART